MNHPVPAPRQPRRRRRRGVAAALLVVLTACGGSTEQYEPFLAQRLIAFGDEASALGDGATAPVGASWSVNGIDSTGAFDCAQQPIWIQSLASYWGLVFAECNKSGVAQPQGKSWAEPGAKVENVAAQIERQEAAGGFRDGDMTTVLVGTNDIVELYQRYPQTDEDTLRAEARARGAQAAQLVNRLIGAGAKVIVANLPDLTYTPYAQRANADSGDGGRSALIGRLAAAFNIGLGTTIILDGRYVGLVQIDQRTQAIGRDPGVYGFVNGTSAVCAVAPPDCTTNTLVTGGNIATWLWAGDRWLSPGGHGQLAGMAIDRATRNPF